MFTVQPPLRQMALPLEGGRGAVWKVGLISLLVSLLVFALMVGRSRLGDPWNHVLTSKVFGVPEALESKGVKPFYEGRIEVGWDGQFYYFAANDLLASRADTTSHIDTPAYRYQRIGLPLIAKGLSLVLGQSWVSPTVYFAASLILVVVASMTLAAYLSRLRQSPYWALLWALGFGTQVTMQTGLPDAAADALLVLAFVGLASQRMVAYGVCAFLAALTREAYVLFPVVVSALMLFSRFKGGRDGESGSFSAIGFVLGVFGVLLFLSWHVYLKLHFQDAGPGAPQGILGVPGLAFSRYLWSGLQGHHLFVGSGVEARREVVQLLLFAALLITMAWLSVRMLKTQPLRQQDTGHGLALVAISVTSLVFVALYFSFGDTVIMHFSGYLKAANVFLWIGPVLWLLLFGSIGWKPKALMVVYVLATIPAMWSGWIWNPGTAMSRYTRGGDVTSVVEQACTASPKVDVRFVRWELPVGGGVFASALRPYDMIAWVRVRNLENHALVSAHAKGSVNMGARWRQRDSGKVVGDGPRTLFGQPLLPGESRDIAIVIKRPRRTGDLDLIIGPVLERCKWADDDHGDMVLRQNFLVR